MTVSFKGVHSPKEIMLTGVGCHVPAPLSTRHGGALLLERGSHVDYSTINRW